MSKRNVRLRCEHRPFCNVDGKWIRVLFNLNYNFHPDFLETYVSDPISPASLPMIARGKTPARNDENYFFEWLTL